MFSFLVPPRHTSTSLCVCVPGEEGDEERAQHELRGVDEEERGGVVRHGGGGFEDRLCFFSLRRGRKRMGWVLGGGSGQG